MSKLIIDAQTGTILNLDECYVVDFNDIPEKSEELSDSEISELARNVGTLIKKIGQDTGWGDNSYRFTVSYSPLSLKDEALSLMECGIYEEDEDEYKKLQWVTEATQEQLEDISYHAMNYDSVWDGYRENVMDAIKWVYNQTTKENN